MRKHPSKTDPSYVYIAPSAYGQSFKVGKADRPFRRLKELGLQHFNLSRVICLRAASEAKAFQLETKVKHYFQRRSPPPERNPLNPHEGRNAEWFQASLLPELDACLEDCLKEVSFERIDDYYRQQSAVVSPGAVAGLGYAATATSSALLNDREHAAQLAQLLRDLIAVSFRVTVLTQPGGELTEVQCQSVARPEAQQRLRAIEVELQKVARSMVAGRPVVVVHPLAGSANQARLHLQLAFAIDPSAVPRSEPSRAIRDIYAEALSVVQSVGNGWEQPAICVMDSLGIRPRKPRFS